MFAFWALLALPWLWFYFGLGLAIGYALSLVFLAFVLKRARLSIGMALVSSFALINLELSLHHILPRHAQHQDIELTVCAEQPLRVLPEYLSGTVKVLIQPEFLSLRTIRLTASTTDLVELLPGQCISGVFRLRQPFGRLIPGEFDPDRYFFSQSIDARAQLRQVNAFSHRATLTTLVYERVQKHFKQQAALELWSALVLGWSSSLDTETKFTLAANQLSHLFVISGFHIAIVASLAHFFMALVAWCLKPYCRLSSTARLASVGLVSFLYVAFLGFPVPALRAAIMLAVPLLMMMGRFQVSPYAGVTAAMLVIICVFPAEWLGIGSWLSFVAVLAIVAAYRWGFLTHRKWLAVLQFQALMTLLTVFFAFLFDMHISWVGFLSNLVFGPLVAVVVFPLALLVACLPAVFASFFESLSLLGLQWLAFTAVLSTPIKGYSVVIVLFISSIILFQCWLPKPLRLRFMALQLLFCAILLSAQTHNIARLKPKISQLTVFDVGHGLAVLIEHDGKRVLYDTGGRLADGTSFYEAFLTHAIGKLDVLVISHKDTDHSAGVYDVMTRFPHIPIYSGDALAGVDSVDCHSAPDFAADFHFLPVPKSLRIHSNNHSCLLVVTLNQRRVLLTGDADKLVEYWLLQEYPELFPVDVLMLGHHGSGHSSVGDFLYANSSALFLNSGADRARPQWPAARIQQWFEAYAIHLNNTAYQGTIAIDFSEQDLVIKSQFSALRKRLIY